MTTSNPFQPPDDQHVSPQPAGDPGAFPQVLFSFEGRIPRRTYWLWTVLSTLLLYLGALLSFQLDRAGLAVPEAVVAPIGLAVYLPYLWATMAIRVKRWHDRDKSGWWVLVAVIPVVGPLYSFMETGCLRGTHGTNDYGPDPT